MNDTAPIFIDDLPPLKIGGWCMVMRDIRYLGFCHGGVHLWRFPETCVTLNRVSRGTSWRPGMIFDVEVHAFCPIDWEASFLKMTDSAITRYFCTDLLQCDPAVSHN